MVRVLVEVLDSLCGLHAIYRIVLAMDIVLTRLFWFLATLSQVLKSRHEVLAMKLLNYHVGRNWHEHNCLRNTFTVALLR